MRFRPFVDDPSVGPGRPWTASRLPSDPPLSTGNPFYYWWR